MKDFIATFLVLVLTIIFIYQENRDRKRSKAPSPVPAPPTPVVTGKAVMYELEAVLKTFNLGCYHLETSMPPTLLVAPEKAPDSLNLRGFVFKLRVFEGYLNNKASKALTQDLNARIARQCDYYQSDCEGNSHEQIFRQNPTLATGFYIDNIFQTEGYLYIEVYLLDCDEARARYASLM